MKKMFLVLALTFLTSVIFAQNKSAAEKLVSEGVDYHDKGDYNSAIAKYDQALLQDKDNTTALAEKAYSLTSLQRYDEAIVCCKRAIATADIMDVDLGVVYVTYGNCLDMQKKSAEAIQVYDDGIKRFPDLYQLYFNKGIALIGLDKYDEAVLVLQQTVLKNPDHPGSHNALAMVLASQNKHIPSLLASARFLAIEPEGARAQRNLDNMKSILTGRVEKTSKNSFTINIDSGILGDTTADGKPKENSFIQPELILAMSSFFFLDKKYAKMNDAEKTALILNTVCASLKENQAKNSGFYWTYYAPYFIEMKELELVNTFAYIAYASSGDKKITKWISTHSEELKKFYIWNETYKWPSE